MIEAMESTDSSPVGRSTRTPDAEHPIDVPLVRALLRCQHPDLADHPLRLVDSGWDNVMFRLADRWAVRLPRRQAAVPLIHHEQTWLPRLAPRLPLPTPVPVRRGVAGEGYPWPWSVVPWLPGEAADLEPPSPHQARPFADFLRTLHRSAPPDAPSNPLRGVPLNDRREAVEARLQRLQTISDAVTPGVRALWNRALEAPLARHRRWLHGDLHARNVLVREGVLQGVIDWGDLTSGDVATDLASIWMLFDEPAVRRRVMRRYGATEAQALRAQGWAVFFGTVFLETGLADHPRHAAIGASVLRRLVQADGAW